MVNYTYQVGGSLPINAPTYVSRQADEDLYNTLKKGDFCYVLNSRQMGKSSLRVRAMKRLQDENYACVNIDITSIGTATISQEEWYFGVVDVIVNSLDLYDYLDVDEWWEQENKLSVVNRFSKFLREVLLKYIEQKIVIFIDEIDSILSLPFNIDDFFAVIRESYNQRVNDLSYYRLTFCLIGVATPSDLISDKKRTPFNIGTAIELSGFILAEAQPLMLGFAAITNYPQAVMQEILKWTGGQPFLTQKVCNLLLSSPNFIKPLVTPLAQEESQEIVWVKKLVEEKIIKNWESQDEPEHLRTIQNRILVNQQTASSLLSLYQQVLNNSLKLTGNPEETRLRLTGLVMKKLGNLQVYNQVYGSIFNETWVNNELSKLRPYSESFNAWIESNCQDESRLLTGQALIDALQWAKDKNLSNQDFNFLSASQKFEQENLQIKLKLEKQLIETEKLQAQDENSKIHKINQILAKQLKFSSIGAILMTSLTIISIYFGLQVEWQRRKIENAEILALMKSEEILLNSNQQFDGLLTAMTIAEKLHNSKLKNTDLNIALSIFLAQNLNTIKEKNRLTGHLARVYSVDFNSKYNLIVSASADNTLKLWNLNGNLIKTITGHNDKIWDVVFSPNGQLIASGGADNIIKIWDLQGKLIYEFTGHTDIYNIKFSPDGNLIASTREGGTIRIWDINQKKLVTTLAINQDDINSINFSPDGQSIVLGSKNGTVKIWNLNTNLATNFPKNKAGIFTVNFSNNGQMIIAGDLKGKIQIFSLDGQLLNSFMAHKGIVRNVQFSKDDQQIISAGDDSLIKFWSLDGTEQQTYFAHTGGVWKFKFNDNQEIMVSGGQDNLVKIWNFHKENNYLLAHKNGVWAVNFSPDGKTFVSGGNNNLIKLWNKKGELINTLPGHNDAVMDVKFSPDGQLIASASRDKTIKIWNKKGELLKTLTGHADKVYSISFSHDSKILVSSSADKTVKFWHVKSNDHQPFQTIKSSNGFVNWVSFSPDSKKIAIALQHRKIEVWDINGNLINTIAGHFDQVFYVSFNFDGSKIISASKDDTVKIWDSNGQLINTLTGHRGAVTSVAISPDHQLLASSSWDETVKIWHINEAKLLGTLEHNDKVNMVNFSPDGNTLISASRDGSIKIWNLEEHQLIKKGCNWLQDYFSSNSSQKFLKENDLFCQKIQKINK
jgi:WD40 repeat protein